MLAARGIEVNHESIRHWCLKFGKQFANDIRRRRGRLGDTWQLDVISATWLPRVVRRVYSQSPEPEKALKSQIILASADPKKNNGALPLPWTDVYSFSSPNFDPVIAKHPGVICNGRRSSATDAYIRAANEILRSEGLLNLVNSPDMAAQTFAHNIEEAVRESPTAGVSVLFQAAMVTRGRYSIQPHVYSVIGPGDHIEQVKFPPIAKSYPEFREICRQSGLSADACIC